MDEYLRTKGYIQPILGLIEKVNEAYHSEHYVCLDLLFRKLLETLLIQLLLKNPGPTAIWVDSSCNNRKTLHTILRTFWEYMETSYKPFAAQYDESILSDIRNGMWDIKKLGDQKAHTLLSSATKDRTDARREIFQLVLDFLIDIREKIPEDVTLEHVATERKDVPILPEELDGFVKLVDGQWILTRRAFPNQYIPVLIFFRLHSESPQTTQQLNEWLAINNLDIANPSIITKRLINREDLAVIRDENGFLRCFLTENGNSTLKKYLNTERN